MIRIPSLIGKMQAELMCQLKPNTDQSLLLFESFEHLGSPT